MSRRKEARQQQILGRLSITPTLRVGALARDCAVTTETIRRDLEELAEQGLIARTYGGAMLQREVEPALAERALSLVAERAAIARAAVAAMQGARVVMLGSGATTTLVAQRLALQAGELTVIAHSTSIAAALAVNPKVTVILAPGVYHAGEGALHGAQTVRFLADYAADWAVCGASALSPLGPSDALIEAGEVFSAMLRQGARTMVVADHSKFDRIATARYADWGEVDHLVSDAAPTGPLAQALRVAGVGVTLASR